jgi:glucosyl-dolichyl phosphate glucuronosyltransferase
MRPWMLPQHHWVMASTGFLDPENPSSAVGANWAYRAEVTEKVPLYDEELSAAIPVYEDTLYSMQLKQAGYRLGMETTAIASHHFQPNRLTREAFIKRVSNDGKGRAYLAWNWKHEDLGRPYSKYLALRWRLLCLRIMRRPKALGYLPLWEFELVEQISFLRTYLRLRNYEPAYTRFGLLKIRSGHAAETFAES